MLKFEVLLTQPDLLPLGTLCSNNITWLPSSLLWPLEGFSPFHTWTAALNLSRHYSEDRTLNGRYPASSLVQSRCKVRFNPCVKRVGRCPENQGQRASGRVDDVSIMQIARKTKEYKHPRVKKIYSKTPTKMRTNWRKNGSTVSVCCWVLSRSCTVSFFSENSCLLRLQTTTMI